MSYLLDTNIISEFVRPRPDPNVLAWLDSIPEDETYISVVTLAEVRSGIVALPDGVRKRRLAVWLEADVLQRFDGRILQVDEQVANCWGEFVGRAKRSGRHVHTLDAFLGATARVYSLVLVTRNMRDFGDMGLVVKNPWQPD